MVAISFSRGFSQPRDRTASLESPALTGEFFTAEPAGQPPFSLLPTANLLMSGTNAKNGDAKVIKNSLLSSNSPKKRNKLFNNYSNS